jgi:hypothetical protein
MPAPLWKEILRRFRGAWLCLAVLSIAAAAAELALSGAETADRRPTPELHRIAPALMAMAPSVWFLLALRRARREERRAWPRIAIVGSALHFALVPLAFVAMFALVIVVGGLKLFDPTCLGRSSEGAAGKVGYLYTRGLLCGYEVWERPVWTLSIRRVESVSTRGCSGELPPKLVWSASEKRFELELTNPEERFGEDSFGFTFH